MAFVGRELCTCFKANYKVGDKDLTRYPEDIGITGRVFKEGREVRSDDGKKGKEFSGIDGMEGYEEMRDYVFAPTYGLNGVVNGVLQLYNKKGEEVKIEAYQKFVGVLIQTVIDINKAMDIELNVKKVLNALISKATLYNKSGLKNVTDIEEIQFTLENLKRIFSANENTKRKIMKKNPMLFGKS